MSTSSGIPTLNSNPDCGHEQESEGMLLQGPMDTYDKVWEKARSNKNAEGIDNEVL